MSRSIRVLVVDDDLVDLQLTRRLFAGAPAGRFHLASAERLEEAIRKLGTESYDVLLLDLNLPGSNGLATLEAVRSVTDEVPVIVLSGLDDEETALRSLDHGAQDYLVKGQFTPAMIVNAVRYAISRHQLLHEIKSAKELLERKNRRLAEMYDTAHGFVDNVSHEFRTPLTVIKEYTSLMRDGLAGDLTPEQREFLDIVNDRADDLNTLVEDMLDVGRLEHGRLGVRRRHCTVEEIISRVRPSLERKAAIKGVDLSMHIDPDTPAVYCDDEKAGRVIINLTVNAIKFCQKDSQVRIIAGPDGQLGGATVSVADNGPGISPMYREEIFERFKQLHVDTRSSCKGFGLGLNIAKALVDLNFGEIYVESTIGQGSTFTFTLPPAIPRKVVERYLQHLKTSVSCIRNVALIVADIEEDNQSAADDITAYLDGLLRRYDLLLQLDACRWLLVSATDETELTSFLAGAEETLRELNRNRPQGPLPRIKMRSEGVWRVPDDENELCAVLQRHLQPQELVHA